MTKEMTCPHCGDKLDIDAMLEKHGLRAMPAVSLTDADGEPVNVHLSEGAVDTASEMLKSKTVDVAELGDVTPVDVAELIYNRLDNLGALNEHTEALLVKIIAALKQRRLDRVARAISHAK